jgi:thymidine kinase
VPDARDIVATVMAAPVEVVAIDEVEFFGADVAEVANRLATDGYEVIVSGLDTDFAGRPFGALPTLLSQADTVTKLTAVCTFPGCGEDATRTQRLVNNEPAAIDDPLIVIGGTEDAREPDRYEARCRNHHRVAPARHPTSEAPAEDAAPDEQVRANGNGSHELEADVFSLSELPAP